MVLHWSVCNNTLAERTLHDILSVVQDITQENMITTGRALLQNHLVLVTIPPLIENSFPNVLFWIAHPTPTHTVESTRKLKKLFLGLKAHTSYINVFAINYYALT